MTRPSLSEPELHLLRRLVIEGAVRVGPDRSSAQALQAAGMIRTLPAAGEDDLYAAATGVGFRALRRRA